MGSIELTTSFRSHAISSMASWISLTSLLVITLVTLSLTNRVDGKKRGVQKGESEQGLGGTDSPRAPGKEKLQLKRKKQRQRKKAGKEKKFGRNKQTRKHKVKHGKNKKAAKGKGKGEKGKNKKKGKKNKNKRKLTKQAEKKSASEEDKSGNEDAARQLQTTDIPDPDRYNHCDYIDLVEVGYRDDSTCKPGDKVIFKGGKGIRRQFLMTPQTNAVVFLAKGKKVPSCNNTFNDVTSKVRCKPVNGVKEISGIQKTNGGATCLDCANAKSDGCKEPTKEPTPITASDTEVHCRCPEERTFICTYKVESNANSHTVTCNRNTVTKIYCGSDLVAKTTVNNPVERYSQPLCTTKEYTSILIDLKFSCKDKSIPVPSCEKCEGECETDETTSGTLMTTAMPRRFRDFRIFHNL